jgi:hypothetical protein
MRSDRFTPPAARTSPDAGPPGSTPGAGWLTRLLGGLVALVMVAAAIIFSAVVLAVVAVVAAAALGWFWWKTRAVRRQLREAAARAGRFPGGSIDDPAMPGAMPGPMSDDPARWRPGQPAARSAAAPRGAGQREPVSDARIIREIDPGQ